MLGSLQHSLFQKIKVCSSIALPLDKLQPVNVSFDRAITPRKVECGFEGGVVALHALRKGPQ